jgi:hypothetical protein
LCRSSGFVGTFDLLALVPYCSAVLARQDSDENKTMPDKLYLIRFKGSGVSFLAVIVATAEIYDEHLVFLRSDGKLAALFLLDIVESWSEFELYSA